jgi:thioredoxin-like negative regulator of GroEL
VSAIPTLIFMKDGQAVGQTVGVRGKEDLRAVIEKVKQA